MTLPDLSEYVETEKGRSIGTQGLNSEGLYRWQPAPWIVLGAIWQSVQLAKNYMGEARYAHRYFHLYIIEALYLLSGHQEQLHAEHTAVVQMESDYGMHGHDTGLLTQQRA